MSRRVCRNGGVRILVCASAAPLPPLDGARLALAELCRHLAGVHEVCVLAYRWPDQHGDAPGGVELRELAPPELGPGRRAADRAVSLARREPTDVPRLGPPMARAVAALRRERTFDVAHVTLGMLAGVAPALAGLPSVLAPLDAWELDVAAEAAAASGPRRVWLALQHRVVVHYTRTAYRPFGRVVLVTADDARATARRDPRVRTAVVPNGVDAERFRPEPGRPAERDRMLFTGDLATAANRAAAPRLAEEILPRVRAVRPDVELMVVGRRPPPAVRALGDRPGVRVVADAPDLQPWLAGAGVYACPLERGTGMKNKLLEAMACAAPAVATPSACRGLDVHDGEHLVVAEGDEAIAGAVGRLLADPVLAGRLGDAARRYVVERHDWAEVARRYEALYAEVIAEARGPGPSPAAGAPPAGAGAGARRRSTGRGPA